MFQGDSVTSDENELLSALLSSVGARSRLAPYIRTADLQQGQVVAEPLEPISHAYFPYSGAISFFVPLKDGQLVQTAVVGRDGAVGALQALGGKSASSKCIVTIPGRAAVIQAERLAEVVHDYPALHAQIASHELFFLSEVEQSAACNAVHTVQQRISRWILRLNDLVGINVALTQELLAGMIGVRRTTVTLAAALLQAEGIIRYRRGHIQIVDLEGLRKSSCECYQTLQDYQQFVRLSGAAESATEPRR